MRKISSQEKEIKFLTKRLGEAENLNMILMSDLSKKNDQIESLDKEMINRDK